MDLVIGFPGVVKKTFFEKNTKCLREAGQEVLIAIGEHLNEKVINGYWEME
ncbi:MAG: hypothetical protein K2H91_04135 [Lachnospiraceae bacterium]|nr:hypothetical protein [Lachnospiraceae bacterium]